MKKFDMKTVQVETASGSQPMSYRDLITAVVKAPTAEGGVNVDEMHRRCRILEALDRAKAGVLLLEDQDADALGQCLKAMKWGMVDIEIGRFCKALEAALEEDVEVAEAALEVKAVP